MVLNLCINLVITKYKLKSQFKLTQLWPLTVNCFKVSSQSYLAGLSKIYFLCTNVDQMPIQSRLLFCFKFSFTIFLLIFFPLFLNVFTNILKNYELPKVYNKLKKYLQKIFKNSKLYWKYILGSKDLFGTKLKKTLDRMFFQKM